MKRSTVRLVCDGCGALRQGKVGQTIDELRTLLRSVGWACDSKGDTCSVCLGGAR